MANKHRNQASFRHYGHFQAARLGGESSWAGKLDTAIAVNQTIRVNESLAIDLKEPRRPKLGKSSAGFQIATAHFAENAPYPYSSLSSLHTTSFEAFPPKSNPDPGHIIRVHFTTSFTRFLPHPPRMESSLPFLPAISTISIFPLLLFISITLLPLLPLPRQASSAITA